ncbi:ArsC/Spx/MgsR family protein [Breznakia pachnodae]|uniref:Regulatory protein spx n=1 Tax=Breznakia pachnodae TaxID=265178 RepID=A0ABU0E4I0_9FIRM|nr:ArsC/Spx/MgsR family protein [Breznakia pachnodae]MDQ0361626.1 regulatory protein spx [Breznakia pachnodae]
MIVVYTNWGNVGSKRAKDFLIKNKKVFVEKNIQTSKLSTGEIKYLLSRCENGTSDLISTRSKPYMQIHKDIDDMSISQLAHFIQEKPNMLKLPVVVNEDILITGWSDDEIELAGRMQ